MALIASLSIPLYAVLVALFNRKFIENQHNVMVAYAATESRLIDTMKGVDEIKNTNKQNVFKQIIQVMYGIFQDCGYKLGMIGNKFGLIAQIISVLSTRVKLVYSIKIIERIKKHGDTVTRFS